jgi:hypothetical protein
LDEDCDEVVARRYFGMETVNNCLDFSTRKGRDVGFMKHASEMSSDGMTYIPSYIKIGSGVQNCYGGGLPHIAM